VAANLGVALALTGNDVICVDADPTHPRLAQYLEIPEADVKTLDWQGGAPDLSAALREVQIGNGAAAHGAHGHTDRSESRPELDRMNSAVGDRPPGRVRLLTWGNEQDTLAHPSIADLASELKARAGYVIVDTRPLSSGTTLGLLAVADETVIVVREEKTTREQARFARQTLETLQISSYSLVAIGSD
jgi:Mrp family chromosome partitioning ATPase